MLLSSSRGHPCLTLDLPEPPTSAQGEIIPDLGLFSEQRLTRRERIIETRERGDRNTCLWPKAGKDEAGGAVRAVPSCALGEVVGVQVGRGGPAAGPAAAEGSPWLCHFPVWQELRILHY